MIRSLPYIVYRQNTKKAPAKGIVRANSPALAGRIDEAPLTTVAPVRTDGFELAHNCMLRKYVCTVAGVAQDLSLPPKNVLRCLC